MLLKDRQSLAAKARRYALKAAALHAKQQAQDTVAQKQLEIDTLYKETYDSVYVKLIEKAEEEYNKAIRLRGNSLYIPSNYSYKLMGPLYTNGVEYRPDLDPEMEDRLLAKEAIIILDSPATVSPMQRVDKLCRRMGITQLDFLTLMDDFSPSKWTDEQWKRAESLAQ